MTPHPSPTGPTHPTPTGPSSPPPPPRLGEVIRDAERLGAQMIAVLRRAVDPRSVPDGEVCPGVGLTDYALAQAIVHVRLAGTYLEDLAAQLLPPAGSAVKTTRVGPGEMPTPGSAAAAGHTARESPGGFAGAPGAGASSGPSPHHSERASDDHRRGAGPGVLGEFRADRQVMPGTAALARSINEALARRSP